VILWVVFLLIVLVRFLGFSMFLYGIICLVLYWFSCCCMWKVCLKWWCSGMCMNGLCSVVSFM